LGAAASLPKGSRAGATGFQINRSSSWRRSRTCGVLRDVVAGSKLPTADPPGHCAWACARRIQWRVQLFPDGEQLPGIASPRLSCCHHCSEDGSKWRASLGRTTGPRQRPTRHHNVVIGWRSRSDQKPDGGVVARISHGFRIHPQERGVGQFSSAASPGSGHCVAAMAFLGRCGRSTAGGGCSWVQPAHGAKLFRSCG